MYSRTISEINLIKKDNKIQVKLYKEEEPPKEPYTVEINHKNKNACLGGNFQALTMI